MLNKLIKYFLAFSAIIAMASCNISDDLDRYTEQSRSDIIKGLTRPKNDEQSHKTIKKYNITQAPIPKISSMISFPKPPKFTQGNQIISFSVTENIDLKDVLIELGRSTGIDVDIDPNISGGIIINAKNRPLIEVIERIAKLGSLTYSFDNGILTFKDDVPYAKHYLVDYLVDGSLWEDVSTNLGVIVSNTDGQDGSINLNKSAGIITIFASSIGHQDAVDYLEEVKKSASAQVLIEAKVVEVTLNDQFAAGIDWSFLDGGTSITNTPTASAATNPFTATIAGSGVLGGDVGLTLSALETFGNVRAISSPRISALNNQQAKLDFVNKLVYFTLEVETNTTSSDTPLVTNSVTATMNEEPIGVELSITPSIDLKSSEITLAVNPKLSIQNGTATDPSVDSNGNSLGNEVPIIQTREINTSMKVKSGDTLVIGGLMQEDATNTDTGVPFLSRIPFLGNLFKYVTKTTDIVETVIFIKATIVDSSTGVDKYDRDFHNSFTTDKRPYF